MALGRLFIILVIVAIVIGDQHELETENKTKKTMAAEKETRSANPKDRGSLKQISSLLKNNTKPGRKKNILRQLNINDDMMNDNEGVLTVHEKPSNDSLARKIDALRPSGPNYTPASVNTFTPQVVGVYCNFENASNVTDMCMWQWNASVSRHGLGFSVATAADLALLNKTTRGLKFSGPPADADGNVDGHFLYLPVDPTMENMVIRSPLFRGLWETCQFEAWLHQSRMQNASIRLVSESESGIQWILTEVTGNNYEEWRYFKVKIAKIQQEVNIMVEITRPSFVSLNSPLPHIAIDNIRMVDCVPEPPIYNGQCKSPQHKCEIMGKESCIKLQQVCDLVKDCDSASDENQNCDKMPYGSYCDFELDFCGFENIPQPILKWVRHSGPTPTDKTGPNHDHTCGPPETHSAIKVIPPLFPAHMNHTLTHCVGYYLFVNMNVTGPNQEKADFASTAVMKTVVFNPPPRLHGRPSSRYYNCCMIRFYYQQNGRNTGSLSVNVVELSTRGNISHQVWFSHRDKGENWLRAIIFLPNITRRYYLEFKTRRGMRIYSDAAIDDFSMAPECFGLNIDPDELGDYNYYDPVFEEKTTPHHAFADKIFYRFTTCGATGRFGPNQTMCDAAYNQTGVSVTVNSGVQVWQVPHEGLYTIIALGASGGLGGSWVGVAHGASARALFELHKGEKIHMLMGQQGHNACKKVCVYFYRSSVEVGAHGASARALFKLHKGEKIHMLMGQQGLNACKKGLSAQETQECNKRANDSAIIFTSKTHEVRNTHVQDGGGGGGGATYVFLIDKEGQEFPLLVAGGGGGISLGTFHDDGSQHARPATNATPESGYMYGQPGQTPGAGGGWVAGAKPITPGFELVRGGALKDGATGGLACVGQAHGGFGGGGGGCRRGGGGGGWIATCRISFNFDQFSGGNTNEGHGHHSEGGWSYVDTARAIRDYSEVTVGQRSSPGEVLIIPAIHDCGCAYRCVALNEHRSEVRCYCPSTWTTDANDPTKCILEESWTNMSNMLVWVLGVFCFIFALIFVIGCLYMYNIYQRRKESELRQKHLLEQEVQLHRLRNAPGGTENPLSMAFNPHYGSENILPQGIDVRGLPQVSREALKLVKALGQGAFGEVYQGLYRHGANNQELPVAVKTLPELSTGQAESDFLMEAAIMAKFRHANIVHLIGVCFDSHPRFIVLELLAGGDLKNFLRESRPRPERASVLTMKDLLLCSIDVCKGCKYLESNRFIHRDIAARNCLLSSRGPGRVVKIADFGMARDIYRADYYKKGGKAMLPIKWMPPEAYIDGVFTIKTDVWSFGVLLWEVFSLGVMPYTGCANREVMEMVSSGGRLEKPYGCPQEIYRLMCDCWNPTPTERPSFANMLVQLECFLKDPEIVSAPLPVVRSLLPPTEVQLNNGPQRAPPSCDYLEPTPRADPPPTSSSTDQLLPHSKSPTATPDHPGIEDSQYPPLLKASQGYGNIPMASRRDSGGARREAATPAAETNTTTKFLPSNSTDRLLSSVDGGSVDSDSASEDGTAVWETSFSERPERPADSGPAVDKLISITPTSPKPPENALSKAIDANVNIMDKTNHSKNSLVPERKTAPIASPDPPRITAWAKEPPKLKPKPLCLDAAQLEQNLNALKKNSGSVNLTTMNILPPPYFNVVTPNKISESKTIQIDPKKAVIQDLNSPREEPKEEKTKLKQSNSAASLLNGPMTDVPYADSDNASSSSGSNGQNQINNQKNKNYSDVIVGERKIIKQGSNGVAESEISC
ncbi:tyrosine-protein kinase receptor-like [Cydia splendana]|uniref:tyrosine-protein kinase receptor-like n=1 Tax=Cydia splendana TaxID=1100963 RepID=UPI00300CD51E